MQPIPFTAESAEAAVAQIRAKLGPEAVVLNVRRLPLNGIARLWQKPMIEVLAYRPEAPETVGSLLNVTDAATVEVPPISETLAEFRQELHEIKKQVRNRPAAPARKVLNEVTASTSVSAPASSSSAGLEFPSYSFTEEPVSTDGDNWRVGAVLQKSGLLPLASQHVMDQLHSRYGDNAPATIGEEVNFAQAALAKSWRQAPPIAPRSTHILVGPAGSGKTTCLSKWITQAALMEGRSARVWRLDSATANMAESLSVYCEILGVPSERAWQAEGQPLAEDIGFIDLPGIDWRKPLAMKELAGQIKQLGSPRVHLVLNGAYDISILLAQLRAFSVLPIEDLIITHLDEETHWGKLWNLVLGTNYSIRHFSTGQNIPGDFHRASAEMIFSRQFPNK